MKILYAKVDNTDSQDKNADMTEIVKTLIILAFYAQKNTSASKAQRQSYRRIFVKFLRHAKTYLLPTEIFKIIINEFNKSGSTSEVQPEIESLFELVVFLQEDLKGEFSMSPVLLEILNSARLMAGGSHNARVLLSSKIGVFKDPLLTNLFFEYPDFIKQTNEFIQPIADLVRFFGGTGYNMTSEERKAAKERDPERYDEFLTYRREAVKKAKYFAQNWVRQNHEKDGLANYQHMMTALEKRGFTVHNFPKDFIGLIDDQGRIYTTAGKLILGVPNSGQIRMNPNYDPEEDNVYVFESMVEGGLSWKRYYTNDYTKRSNIRKFEKVNILDDIIKKMRKKWVQEIKQGKKSLDLEIAIILEIIYHTQGRIGGVGNQTYVDGKYEQTYGISTLQVQHINPVGKNIMIMYKGKKLGQQQHILEWGKKQALNIVIEILNKRKKKAKKPNSYIFITKRGSTISNNSVNEYLRKIGAPQGVTIHKFRHLKGVQMMNEIVKDHPFTKSNGTVTGVNRWLKTEAESIGAVLGHMSGDKVTGTTAISAYCSPSSMLKVYKEAGVVPPNSMLKLVGIDPNSLQGINLDELDI